MNCPRCGNSIYYYSNYCPSCGFQVNVSSEQTNRFKDPKFIKIVLGFVIVCIIAFLFQETSVPFSVSPSKIDAYVMMEEFVKDRLKAPSTAEFESSSTIGYKQVDNLYVFSGYVDSQNSFGAMLRKNFTMSMRYNPTTEKWTLDKFFWTD